MHTFRSNVSQPGFNAAVKRILLGGLTLTLLAPAARAQTVFTQGNALSNRTYNTDAGPTNSQLTLDFPITQAGVLQSILTWGQNTGGGGPTGLGESFKLYVFRPLNSTNFQVVFATDYLTVTNLGTNLFAVSGAPFILQTNDVIAHYGRGIPLSINTGGPSSVYVAVNLPAPVVDSTITVPSATYPLYNDGGRDYAIQVRVAQPFLVTTNASAGPGSLRQAVLNANASGGPNLITFAPKLSGQTITLTSEMIVTNNIGIDASGLPDGLTISGGNSARLFSVNSGAALALTGLRLTGGNGAGATDSGLGGAIYNNAAATLTLNRCWLYGNIAPGEFVGGVGGAIYNLGQCTASQCAFTGNLAPSTGGAIGNYASLALVNCTVADNASTGGGAIFNVAANCSLTNCTLSGNSAPAGTGGGILNYFSTATIVNSIVAGNIARTNNFDDLTSLSSSVNYLGVNLFRISYTDLNSSGSNTDPQLAPLGNYGGPTPTMPPLPGSPAINSAGATALATDQRGSARGVGGGPDIGAVESGGLWVQNTNNSGANSLREVILSNASITNSKTILFVPGLNAATLLLTSEIVLTNDLAIDASSLADGIQISGGNSTRLFSLAPGTSVSLRNLVLLFGTGAGQAFNTNGGAVLNQSSNATLTRCTFIGNSASSGGAVFNFGAMQLAQCTFYGNSALNSAGAIGSQGSLLAVNCTFATNQAPSGGALTDYAGQVSLAHCTLVGNNAAIGGGIYNFAGTPVTLTNCIVAGNTASSSNNLYGPFAAANLVVDVDPKLAGLGNYGGHALTMPPLPGSPAVNTASATGLATDQRGFPRPVGLAADSGAVEGIYNAAGPGKITSVIQLGNGAVQLGLTNLTDASFRVVATTNLSLSLSNWTPIGYAIETAAGTGLIQFIDPDAPKYPRRFYRVTAP